jgi:putative phosphoesterase
MRIGIISDTHGDVEAWEKAMRLLEGCDWILHAGDHLYNGAFNPVLPSYHPKRLAELMNACETPMLHARGNCDSEVDTVALRDPLSPLVLARLGDLQIVVMHGHTHDEDGLAELAARYRADLMVRGHTHLPGIQRRGSLLMVNPGSISLPQGGNPPSLGLVEGGRVRLLDLAGGEEIAGEDL